jgi:hypothetical protein
MPDEQPTAPQTPAAASALEGPKTTTYEPPETDREWFDEPSELPRRPRRRLLTPIPIALAAVLAIACGFIGGVLVEKGQSSSTAAGGAAGIASQFASLRSGAGRSGAAAGGGASAAGGSTGSGEASGGRAGGAGGARAGAGATAGQVAYISGDTLYVTTTEGNTVKVKTSPASTVTKTVKTSVKGIHPGETVLITGASGANGAITAESIRVGATGASGGGGLGGLFGGSTSGAKTSTGGATSGRSGGGEPALFGNGG